MGLHRGVLCYLLFGVPLLRAHIERLIHLCTSVDLPCVMLALMMCCTWRAPSLIAFALHHAIEEINQIVHFSSMPLDCIALVIILSSRFRTRCYHYGGTTWSISKLRKEPWIQAWHFIFDIATLFAIPFGLCSCSLHTVL